MCIYIYRLFFFLSDLSGLLAACLDPSWNLGLMPIMFYFVVIERNVHSNDVHLMKGSRDPKYNGK